MFITICEMNFDLFDVAKNIFPEISAFTNYVGWFQIFFFFSFRMSISRFHNE